MIEERERLVRRQRGEPQREAGELDRHWIEIHTEETSLCHLTPHQRTIGSRDVAGMPAALADQGFLDRPGQKAASANQKRAASHRRIHHPQGEDVVR